MTVSAASSVAEAALSRTVALRKSPKRKSVQERGQQDADAVGAVDHRVRLLLERRGTFVGAHAHAQGVVELAQLLQLGQPAERVEVGRIVADVDRRGEVRIAQQADD